ncbi:hypothetical protein HO173_002090 [Letharia columbiana]|uniref:Uncharacterized protein n=1 Tax=Letharia columbiana TaxID=112416 RepID=A0A8H6G2Y9_9LECA|nr:uncharacterized protein HO173_002090 [Letharia columbiana]KAF6239546.1 hypothetical protein HO173_002090 [Letharia columbiana]
MALCWTENGIKATVGCMQTLPWPLAGTGASNETQTLVDLTQRSNIYVRYPPNITVISATNVSGGLDAPALNHVCRASRDYPDHHRGLHHSLLDLADHMPALTNGRC